MHLDRGVRCHHLDRGDEMHKCRDTQHTHHDEDMPDHVSETSRSPETAPLPQFQHASSEHTVGHPHRGQTAKDRILHYCRVSPEDTPVNVPSLGVTPGRPSRANTYRGKALVDKLWTHILKHRSTFPEQRKRKTPADGKDRREAKSVPQCKWSHMSGHTQATSELPRHVHQSVT